jgi:hypothetical protein
MADRIFLWLNDRFALGADSLQWILYKSRAKIGPPMDAPLGSRDWNPICFVSSNKDTRGANR